MKTGERYRRTGRGGHSSYLGVRPLVVSPSPVHRTPPPDSTPPILALSEKSYSDITPQPPVTSQDSALSSSCERLGCLRVFPSIPPFLRPRGGRFSFPSPTFSSLSFSRSSATSFRRQKSGANIISLLFRSLVFLWVREDIMYLAWGPLFAVLVVSRAE